MALTKVQTGSIQDNAVTEAKIDAAYATSLNTNPAFTGTDGIVLPKGTTAQRPSDVQSGELRFNTTTNLAEYYDGNNWKSIDSPPTVTQIAIAGRSAGTTGYIDGDAVGGDSTSTSIVISGSLFATGASVSFITENGSATTVTPSSTTINNTSQITVQVDGTDFLNADEPYGVKVTNLSGLAGTLADAIFVDFAPSFATAADTNIGTVIDNQTDFSGLSSVATTDADSDTITHTISAGSLPNGMSLQTNGTFTGTASSLPSSSTEYTFTVQAATTRQTVTRQFKISAIDNPYISATGGTTLTSGNYKTHVFTSPGTFAVSGAGVPSLSGTVEYLVVAGGAGGSGSHGGGGGAGGMRYNYPSPATGGLSISAQSYPITVGSGGSGRSSGGGSQAGIIGGSGGNSVFSSITSAGGGGGAYSSQNSNAGEQGADGGSGGGGGANGQPAGKGTGNSPPVSPPQGNPGGAGWGSPIYPGGGGGGKGGAGQTPGNSSSGGGAAGQGEGISDDFFGPTHASYGTGGPSGTLRYFAGGGGGGVHSGNSHASAPASGGGGAGGTNANNNPGDSASANTGGGGGGSNGHNGTSGSGGSGLVAIRYRYQ